MFTDQRLNAQAQDAYYFLLEALDTLEDDRKRRAYNQTL